MMHIVIPSPSTTLRASSVEQSLDVDPNEFAPSSVEKLKSAIRNSHVDISARSSLLPAVLGATDLRIVPGVYRHRPEPAQAVAFRDYRLRFSAGRVSHTARLAHVDSVVVPGTDLYPASLGIYLLDYELSVRKNRHAGFA